MAVEVVAACHRAEHRAGVDEPRDAGLRQAVLAARDGVPDDEMPAPVRDVEEDAAVAAVEGARAAAVGVGGEGRRRGGGEALGGSPWMTMSLWRRPRRGGVRWKAP